MTGTDARRMPERESRCWPMITDARADARALKLRERMANDTKGLILGIDVTTYLVKDVARAKAFYRDVMGMPMTSEYGASGRGVHLSRQHDVRAVEDGRRFVDARERCDLLGREFRGRAREIQGCRGEDRPAHGGYACSQDAGVSPTLEATRSSFTSANRTATSHSVESAAERSAGVSRPQCEGSVRLLERRCG